MTDEVSEDEEVLRPRSLLPPTAVYRRGDVVYRETGPWAPTVHALLRHLESVGFTYAPHVIGSGFDDLGRETLAYIEGEFIDPGPWTLEGAAALGRVLRELHEATASFRPPSDALWGPWFGRDLGGPQRVIGHCDFAPWNIVTRDGMPVGLIDWDFSGPVDPLVELAQACWLNAKLHDDVVAEREGLPPMAERAKQLRAIVDAYGLPAKQRDGFIDRMVELVIYDNEDFANDAGVTPDSDDPRLIWGFAWRARGAAWLLRNRSSLQNVITEQT